MAASGKALATHCALDHEYLNLRGRERRQAAVLHRGRLAERGHGCAGQHLGMQFGDNR